MDVERFLEGELMTHWLDLPVLIGQLSEWASLFKLTPFQRLSLLKSKL